MATKYSITDEGTYTKVVMQESAVTIAMWSIPKTSAISVKNGNLDIFLGQNKSMLRLPRVDIIIPSSTSDEDLYNTLSAFMNTGSGGGTTYTAQSGVNLNGTAFELGVNPLLKDTKINEANFFLTIEKILNIAGFNVNASLSTNVSDPIDSGTNGLAKFLSAIGVNTSASMGVFGNNTSESAAYWTAVADTKITRLTNQGGLFKIRQFSSGSEIASLGLTGGAWSFTGTAVRFNVPIISIDASNTFYFGNETTDGTISISIVGGKLVFKQRQSGTYNTIYTITAPRNGISVDGATGAFEIGGALIKDTTISGLFQLILQGLTALRLNTDVVQQASTGAYYFGDENTNGTIRMCIVGSQFVVQQRVAGSYVTISSLGGTGTKVEVLDNVTIRRIPFVFDLTGVTLQTLATITLDAGFQYAYKIVANCKKVNVALGGNVIVTGGAMRPQVGAASLHSASPNAQIQESVAGTLSFSHALGTNVLNINATQTDAVKTRYSGYIEIIITQITDAF